MEKVIRDGKVAVLYSPGRLYFQGNGGGWSTWNKHPELVFHPEIVKMFEEDRREEITERFCQKLLGTDHYICVSGAENLAIEWVEEGTQFKIHEFEGDEVVMKKEDVHFFTA